MTSSSVSRRASVGDAPTVITPACSPVATLSAPAERRRPRSDTDVLIGEFGRTKLDDAPPSKRRHIVERNIAVKAENALNDKRRRSDHCDMSFIDFEGHHADANDDDADTDTDDATAALRHEMRRLTVVTESYIT